MPPHPMAPVYKLLWIKEENPKLFAQVQKWIGIKEYIIWRLTGKIVTDTTMAAGIGLLNLHTLTWDRKLLDKIELDPENLPSLAKPDYVVGKVEAEYALQTDSDGQIPDGCHHKSFLP